MADPENQIEFMDPNKKNTSRTLQTDNLRQSGIGARHRLSTHFTSTQSALGGIITASVDQIDRLPLLCRDENFAASVDERIHSLIK